MRVRLLSAALLFASVTPAANADGCKFSFDGRKVPEREQRALIQWNEGIETLHVAALSDPTSEGSVWVVPIRAEAAAVLAEPVDEFPAVVYYTTLRSRARQRLGLAIAFTALFNSGGLVCIPFIGGCGAGHPASAIEASRVEKLGMVLTVVSAQTRAEIETYLDAQGVNRAAADLSSLEPYCGQAGYCFVCGWVGKSGEPVTATGLKIIFPSPTLWFPLRASRAYTEPVETIVFCRGFARPAESCELPGLRCEYIYGAVESKGVRQTFSADKLPGHYYPGSSRLEELTRVTLTLDPQQWDRDLELERGTTAAGSVGALAVTGWLGVLGPLWSALVGAVLGLFIPLLIVPRDQRRRSDWLGGAATGAAIAATLWAALIVFSSWRALRFRGGPNKPSKYLVLPILAAVHFAIVWAVCSQLSAWIDATL